MQENKLTHFPSSITDLFPSRDFIEQGQHYCVSSIPWDDVERQKEYQKLRTDVFVEQLGWDLPVTDEGCECDHYDRDRLSHVACFGVYGRIEMRQTQQLLGGTRLFLPSSWEETMICTDFVQAGMVPTEICVLLQERYNVQMLIELTRLCVRRYKVKKGDERSFAADVVRDLIYAAVYAIAEDTCRPFALAMVDSLCWRVIKHSHFHFQLLHSHQLHIRQGYALVLIDLIQTLYLVREARDGELRFNRMIALLKNKDLFLKNILS